MVAMETYIRIEFGLHRDAAAWRSFLVAGVVE